MRIMKLSMPILVLGLAFFISGTATAQSIHSSFPGGIWIFNPCDGSFVTVSGPNLVNYEQNSTADGAVHVAIHMRFDGTGQDNASTPNPFAVSFIANGQFNSVVTIYEMPYHSVWTGQGNAPSFSMDGVLLVGIDKDGVAFGSAITQVHTSCNATVQ
jgi:hypothetical protein